MIVKNQFFIIFVISLSLFIENGEAGWKFWKKEETTTTTTTTTAATPISISMQSTAIPTKITTVRGTTSSTTNIGTSLGGAVNPGLTIGASATRENIRNNARPNQPNLGTEVGLDISVPRPSRPGFNDGSGQNYRDWAASFTGAGEAPRNQPSKTSIQEPINGADSRFTKSPGNVQPTQPSITVSSTGIDRSRLSTSSPNTSGKTWADVAASGSRPASPTGLPRQPEYSSQSLPDNSQHRVIPGRPMQPNQSNSPSSPLASPKGTMNIVTSGVADVTGGVEAANGERKSSGGTATSDSTTVYSSNPTYSKGNTVTDEDLEKLSEALYIKETNNANRFITVNLQKQTTSSSQIDQAPQPLLTVSAEAFQIPTIQRVLSIFDNYQLDTHINEYISPTQRQEESLLIDTFLSTNVMSTAMRFLADKGFIRKDYYEYKDRLRMIWFNLFSRGQGKIGSTGFEHVFMAEMKEVDSSKAVLGLHNWIYFNAEETKRHVDYLGYIKKINLGNKGSIITMHAKFDGHDKPVTTMFIGTSPELEMALYTVCFYTRPDGNCPMSLGNTKFNVVTRKFKYRGKDLIGTAYPEI